MNKISIINDFELENTLKFNGRVLIIGSGGREHAMAWKIAQSNKAKKVFVAPGNPGCDGEEKVENINIRSNDIATLRGFARTYDIGLTIVGPEVALVDGIVDKFEEVGLCIFGPSQAAARLEGSKDFTKNFCSENNIPTAESETFTDIEDAKKYIMKNNKFPVVIKVDGLASGKGVIIAQNQNEANKTIEDILGLNKFGDAGSKIIIEEFLEGEEVSMIYMVDKNGNILPMESSQDHKARNEGNIGLNTGGMGAYSPVSHIITKELSQEIMKNIIQPTIDGMKEAGSPFSGFLYAGLMITKDGPKLIEYNVRFGDPEAQPLLSRLNSDFLEMCLAGSRGELNIIDNIIWATNKAITVVLVAKSYPEKGSEGEQIIIPENILKDTIIKIFHAGTMKIDGQLQTNGGRILGITTLAPSIKVAKERVNKAVKQIILASDLEFHYRRDIGFEAINDEYSSV